MEKKFLAIWGLGYVDDGQEARVETKTGLEFFDEDLNYSDEDRKSLDALVVGQSYDLSDHINGWHIIIRIK